MLMNKSFPSLFYNREQQLEEGEKGELGRKGIIQEMREVKGKGFVKGRSEV